MKVVLSGGLGCIYTPGTLPLRGGESFEGNLNHGAGTHGLVCLPVPLHINFFQIQALYLF